MKTTAASPIGVLLCCLVTVSWSQQSDEARLAVARGNNVFSTNLYKELSKTAGNAFFSPLSVEVVLALAWLGAGGETAPQMAAALHLPSSRQQVEEGFKSLLANLQSTNGSIYLDIANKIYAQEGFKIKQDFQKSAEQSFLSVAQEVDFQGNAKLATDTINSWVEQKTKNKIKNLITSGSLDASTVMVLVNAIYFKGKWLKQFPKVLTHKEPFHTDTNTSRDVQMMHKTSSFKYREVPELHAKVLQLQYVGNALSMVILLPNEVEGLADLESRLEGFDLTQLLSSLHKKTVFVSLPKFKLEKTMDLNDPLKELGMDLMFSSAANFSNLASQPLQVSKVVQKSYLEVAEEGTEAAAASGIQVAFNSLLLNEPPPPAVFKADHPFIFFITENSSGAVVFMGRFNTPL